MRDQGSWSLGLGRWWGIPVRVHLLFVLFAVGTCYLSWLAGREQAGGMMGVAVASLSLLFLSVLLHEAGHAVACLATGGRVHELLLGPFGGLTPVRPPEDPKAEVYSHFAGPAVNLLLCLLAGVVLSAFEPAALSGLLHPLRPEGLTTGGWALVGFKLLFWINGLLLALNLIPAFPFDGGQIFRALLVWVRPTLSRRTAGMIVARLAQVAALTLLVVAFLYRGGEGSVLVPAWLALVLLAVFLFFSAKQEQQKPEEELPEETLFGYDFSEGYTSLERSATRAVEPEPSAWERWWRNWRTRREQRRREREQAEERRLDDILLRLHEGGMHSLSPADRSLLRRVSARYKSRLEP